MAKFSVGEKVVPNDKDPYYWGPNVKAGTGTVVGIKKRGQTFIYVGFGEEDGPWPYLEDELELAE